MRSPWGPLHPQVNIVGAAVLPSDRDDVFGFALHIASGDDGIHEDDGDKKQECESHKGIEKQIGKGIAANTTMSAHGYDEGWVAMK